MFSGLGVGVVWKLLKAAIPTSRPDHPGSGTPSTYNNMGSNNHDNDNNKTDNDDNSNSSNLNTGTNKNANNNTNHNNNNHHHHDNRSSSSSSSSSSNKNSSSNPGSGNPAPREPQRAPALPPDRAPSPARQAMIVIVDGRNNDSS